MNYLWPSKQFVPRRVASDYALDVISVLATQVDALSKKINAWGDNAFQSPFVTFGDQTLDWLGFLLFAMFVGLLREVPL
ncbi:Uncharacterized protein TCM_018023 [Theobroma cacao]|uniref:Uncharacterized protein n=1 Tax=Theobroma cacao TaxID=3641 RepID=A0A061EEA8_THECC|nr:Uncharacterized protein TCM_018023 [Theobroma cacao]